MNIELCDTFNNQLISRHKSINTAVIARRKHLTKVKRANGPNSYLTYEYRQDGKELDSDLVGEAEYKAFERESFKK